MTDEEKSVPAENTEDSQTPQEQITVVIDVSRDKLEAYLTLIPLTEEPVFSIELVQEALAEKGVKFGIKEEILVLLESEPKYEERILIAKGKAPTEGKEGTIEYCFESNESLKVRNGDKIADILLPEKGEDGVTVFEEVIDAGIAKKALIPTLMNVELSSGKEESLIAGIDGYLNIELIRIQITPFFELEEIKNEYEAYMKVHAPVQNNDYGPEELKQFLNSSKIVYGVLEETLIEIFEQKKFDERIVIARGQKVEDGKDGEIQYFFETEITPKVDEHGNVNYKETNIIQHVKKGEKLAKVMPPVQGTEGHTIFGLVIDPKEGALAQMPSGNNTELDPDNANILVSSIDGCIQFKGKNVDVEPVFIVKENVDYATGNIKYDGAVVINGDVKSGFRIAGAKEVQVNGIVEDAVIEAGGDVLIKTGFIGRGEGKIISQGSVMVKFCNNQVIDCQGDITIGDFVMNGTLKTQGKLLVTEQTGLIVGGDVYALQGIEAKAVGNDKSTPTELYVGVDKETIDIMRVKRETLVKNAENRKEIDKALVTMSSRKLVKKSIPDEKEKLIKKLQELKNKIDEDEKNLLAEIENLEKKVNEFKNAMAIITDVVYPGTAVTITNKRITVDVPLQNVYYRYSEQGVIAADLAELK